MDNIRYTGEMITKIKFDFEELKPILWEQKYAYDRIESSLRTISNNLLVIPTDTQQLYKNVDILLTENSDGSAHIKILDFEASRETLHRISSKYSYIIKSCNLDIDFEHKMYTIKPFNKSLLTMHNIHWHGDDTYLDPTGDRGNYFYMKEFWDGELVFLGKKVKYHIPCGAIGCDFSKYQNFSFLTKSFTSLKLIK